jgi:hypothetical protein
MSIERVCFAGMFEEFVVTDYPWPFKLNKHDLDGLLIDYAVFGYPLLVNDSFIIPGSPLFDALSEKHSFLRVLLDEGFVACIPAAGMWAE